MKIIQGTEKGFFGVVGDTARHISQCIEQNEEWFVEWGINTLYFDKEQGNNAWEYFFKQTYPYKPSNNYVRDYTELTLLKEKSFRKTMNFIHNNYIVLNDKTNEILQPHFQMFTNNKVLGIHIRRTDKFLIGSYGTTSSQVPVDLELFKTEIDRVVNDYDLIFLATDCIDTCNYMKDIYGKKLIFNRNTIRGSGTCSIHNNFKNVSGYVKGLNVITDAFLLSRCQHLIRSTSNVSMYSLFINPNLTYVNVNEKYLNDKSEIDFK